MQHVCKMKIKIEEMRRYGRLICPGKATTLLEKGTVKATSVNIKFLYQITYAYCTGLVPSSYAAGRDRAF